MDGCLFWGSAGVWLQATHQTRLLPLIGWGCNLMSSVRALWVVPRTPLWTKGDLIFAVKALHICNTLPELSLARSVVALQTTSPGIVLHGGISTMCFNVVCSIIFPSLSVSSIKFLFSCFLLSLIILAIFYSKAFCNWCKYHKILSPMSQLNCGSQGKIYIQAVRHFTTFRISISFRPLFNGYPLTTWIGSL